MRQYRLPIALLLLLFIAALALTLTNLQHQLPAEQWLTALRAPDMNNIEQMVFHYSLLPRLSLSLLAAPGWGWWGCCSSRCCAIRWRNRRRWAWRAGRNWALPW